jgi:hypothetical protein
MRCGFAEPMEQEPSRFVADIHHPVKLMRRHAFLARRHKAGRENPFGQRDMRPLHHRADRDAERLPTVFAVVDAGAKALAGHLGNAITHHATARANRTLRPQHGFEVFPSCVVIVKDRIAEVDFAAGHRDRLSTMRRSYMLARATST